MVSRHVKLLIDWSRIILYFKFGTELINYENICEI